jgi:hypothetical protein
LVLCHVRFRRDRIVSVVFQFVFQWSLFVWVRVALVYVMLCVVVGLIVALRIAERSIPKPIPQQLQIHTIDPPPPPHTHPHHTTP